MSSLNKVMLIGRLGKDPEIRATSDGTSVANFSLATSENFTDRNGTRQERTEWHNIVAWRKLADLAKRYLVKGRQVYVEGRIATREYTDREGVKRRTTEITATNLVLLGSRAEGMGAAESPASSGYAPAPAAPRDEPESGFGDQGAGITDDDIPF